MPGRPISLEATPFSRCAAGISLAEAHSISSEMDIELRNYETSSALWRKVRCRITGQNGIPEGSHLVIPSRAGMNFISRKICWIGENGVDVGEFYFVVESLLLRNNSGEPGIIGIDFCVPGLDFSNGRNAGQNHGGVRISLENSTHECLHCLVHPIRWRNAKDIVGSK